MAVLSSETLPTLDLNSIPQDTQDDANGTDIQSKSKRKSVNYLWDKKGSVKNMTNKFETGRVLICITLCMACALPLTSC